MSRGHRVRQENFSMERAAPPDQDVDRSLTPQWSELRVVRKADTVPSLDTDDWTRLLNDLGDRNLGLGNAHSLGSVAITLIPAKEMGRMLQEKYPDAYRGDPRRTSRLHRKIGESVNGYIDRTIRNGFDARTSEMESRYHLSSADVMVQFSNELTDGNQAVSSSSKKTDRVLRELILPLADAPVVFNAGTFNTSKIKIFGNDGQAVDFSENSILSTERQELLAYLKHSEGLDTRRLERDGWLPHATIFTFEQHIAAAELQRRVAIPQRMGFGAVQAVVTGRANPYFRQQP